MPTPHRLLFGLDLGQRNDYSALCVVAQELPAAALPWPPPNIPPAEPRQVRIIERRPPSTADTLHRYVIDHLQRWRGVDYIDVAQAVAARWNDERLADVDKVLLFDATGVGLAVGDILRRVGLSPIPITITGGRDVTTAAGGYNIPKRDLAAVTAVLFEERRCRINAKLDLAPTLGQELLHFRVRVNAKTLHDTYGAEGVDSWRTEIHDDLVLAASLCLWYGERQAGRVSTMPVPRSWR